jgi:hypothetical protein
MAVGAGRTVTQDLRDRESRNPPSLEQTKIILISQYMQRTGNEALLITDADKVNELVKLFSNNRTAGHACGYHWLIWFRQSATSTIPFAHNEECEIYKEHDKRIHSLLDAYFSTIKQNPTHFIFNVKVPASLEPQEAARRLEDDRQKVFFFAGTEQRLPSLTVQATAVSDIPKARSQWTGAESRNRSAARAKLSEALEVLRKRYPIVEITKLDNRYSSFGGGKIEDRVETTIYFPFGTGVNDIGMPNNLRVLSRNIPTDYMIQLIVQEKLSADVKQALMARNSFILDVLAFPNFH